ncbi:MAG: hypothetical protein ACRC2T_00170 [Thermoguttaceae bacterium]
MKKISCFIKKSLTLLLFVLAFHSSYAQSEQTEDVQIYVNHKKVDLKLLDKVVVIDGYTPKYQKAAQVLCHFVDKSQRKPACMIFDRIADLSLESAQNYVQVHDVEEEDVKSFTKQDVKVAFQKITHDPGENISVALSINAGSDGGYVNIFDIKDSKIVWANFTFVVWLCCCVHDDYSLEFYDKTFMENVAALDSLQFIHFNTYEGPASGFDTEGFALLKNLSQIKTLDLTGMTLSPENYEALAEFDNLENLTITHGLRRSVGIITHFPTMPKLKKLIVLLFQDDAITRDAFEPQPELEHFSISTYQDEPIVLPKMPKVKSCVLSHNRKWIASESRYVENNPDAGAIFVFPEGEKWSELQELTITLNRNTQLPYAPNLKSLTIDGNNTDFNLPCFPELESVQMVSSISNNLKIDVQAVQWLAKLPKLHTLTGHEKMTFTPDAVKLLAQLTTLENITCKYSDTLEELPILPNLKSATIYYWERSEANEAVFRALIRCPELRNILIYHRYEHSSSEQDQIIHENEIKKSIERLRNIAKEREDFDSCNYTVNNEKL